MSAENVENYLPEMHIGEVRRDAAPGIRGFLFQDLLAVDELTKKETEFICSEYIEDICAITSKGIRIMDDINLVSFIDLIKYQLTENKNEKKESTAIQQFFFSACDGNLKRLFQYKMEGFEIPVALVDLDES